MGSAYALQGFSLEGTFLNQGSSMPCRWLGLLHGSMEEGHSGNRGALSSIKCSRL